MFEIQTNRAIIHIKGIDSQKFLQSLVTNDVVEKIYSYNYLLNNQGRYLYDFFVYQQSSDSYFIDIDKNSRANLIKHLLIYKLRSQLEIMDVSDLYSILYSAEKISGSVFSLPDTRYNKLKFRSLIKIENIKHLEGEIKDLYLMDKYDFAIIDGSIDLIYEKSIPIEYGAEEFSAIDYKKGCYVGQEVISRAKYQGVIRKKIYKAQIDGIFADEIFADKRFFTPYQDIEVTDINGDKVGKLCSFYKNIAIVILREEKYLALLEKKVIINGYVCNVIVPSWRHGSI